MEEEKKENKGKMYENNINKLLKKYGLQPKGFKPPGSDSTRHDGEFIFKEDTVKFEIKLSLNKDFGQAPLHFSTAENKWIFSETAKAKDLIAILKGKNIENGITEGWSKSGPPRKFTIPQNLLTLKDKESDKKNYKDLFFDIPMNSISTYYNNKGVYFIQIGDDNPSLKPAKGYGLYYLGDNPLKNKGLIVPKFEVELQLRVRYKHIDSGPSRYTFMSAIQLKQGINKPKKSDINLENIDDLNYFKKLNKLKK
jgi:hypothetical protein